MPGHFQNLEVNAEKVSLWRFFDEKIWFGRFDFEREPEVAEKIAIRNHRRREGMTSDLATKLTLNSRNVLDVIDVPVCQQQKLWMNIERAHPFAGALRRVKENPSVRCFK